MSTLILVRHANTFEPGEAAYWVGAKEDPPLSASGRAQLPDLSRRITARLAGESPFVISSPLRRARETAEAIAGGAPVVIDQRLIELDFGPWANLTDAEIVSAGNGAELQAWRDQSTPPAAWNLDELAKMSDLRSLLDECRTRSLTLAVTSNGVLKLLGSLLQGAGPWSVKTAQFCALRLDTGNGWRVDGWSE